MKNIAILLSGSTLALVFPLLVTPMISRFFTPQDFGLWGTYSAIVGLFVVIANGRYEFALLLPDDEHEASNLFIGSVIISVFMAILSLVLVFFFGEYLSLKLGMPALAPWLYLLPPSILIIALQQSGNYWLNRKRNYKAMSTGRVVQSVSTATLNVGLGKWAYFPGGLIVATLIGQVLLSIFYLVKIKVNKLFRSFNWPVVKAMLYKYREYPFKSGPGIFINILKEQAPIFLFAYYFDETRVGFYALIIRVFGAPLSVVAGSIGQVYYQKAVDFKKNNPRRVFELFTKTTSRMLLFLVLPILSILIFGDEIFPLIFGDQWSDAGIVFSAFSVYYGFRFVVSSQSSLLLVFNKLGAELIFNIIALVLQVACLVVGGMLNDFNLAIYSIAVTGSMMYIGLGVYLYVYLKKIL